MSWRLVCHECGWRGPVHRGAPFIGGASAQGHCCSKPNLHVHDLRKSCALCEPPPSHEERVQKIRDQPKRGELWQHFKGTIYQIVEVGLWQGTGTLYEVDTPVLSEGDTIVAYRRIGARKDPELKTFFRYLDDFMSVVPDGRANPTGQKYRFEHNRGEW